MLDRDEPADLDGPEYETLSFSLEDEADFTMDFE